MHSRVLTRPCARLATCVAAAPQPDKITPSLIAFCAFLAGQIATTSPRTRGHKKFLGVEMHTNLKDRDEWNAGITTALKFMKDRKQCPTHCPMLMEFQRDKKRKQ